MKSQGVVFRVHYLSYAITTIEIRPVRDQRLHNLFQDRFLKFIVVQARVSRIKAFKIQTVPDDVAEPPTALLVDKAQYRLDVFVHVLRIKLLVCF